MSKTDFNEFYHLGGISELVQRQLEELGEDNSKLDSLDAALRVETHFKHFEVRRRNEEDMIQFSTDHYTERSPHVLLLMANVRYKWSIGRWSFRPKRRIVTTLNYEPMEDGIKIHYEQSVEGIGLQQYHSIQELLGVRPHELLVAHLIARVAPVLDLYSDMNVQFSNTGGQFSSIRRPSYRMVLERFAKSYGYDEESQLKIYKMSPQKERVKQIFGVGSAWLEAPR